MKNRFSTLVTLFLALSAVFAATAAIAATATATEAICPVCRVHEGETEAETVVASIDHDGHSFGFCSTDCRDRFLEAPASYVPPVFPRPAPAFVVRDLEGKDLASATLEGRTILLDFWATWCPPCVADLPKLSALHDRYNDAGLTVVSVSIDEGKGATRKVARMIKKRKATHPVFLDSPESPAWADYLVRTVPAQFLIDASGNIVAQWLGKVDLENVETEIARLLDAESDGS